MQACYSTSKIDKYISGLRLQLSTFHTTSDIVVKILVMLLVQPYSKSNGMIMEASQPLSSTQQRGNRTTHTVEGSRLGRDLQLLLSILHCIKSLWCSRTVLFIN